LNLNDNLPPQQIPHPDPRLRDVRPDGLERRLHALLLLLPVVPAGLQEGARLRRRLRHLGGDLGGQAHRLRPLRPLPGPGPAGDLPRHHPLEQHGLHRCHQVLQWQVDALKGQFLNVRLRFQLVAVSDS